MAKQDKYGEIENLKSMVILLLLRGYELNRTEFEKKVMTLKFDKTLEPLKFRKAILKHFKEQVYPVPYDALMWMRKNIKKEYGEMSGINFKDRYIEMKKLFVQV